MAAAPAALGTFGNLLTSLGLVSWGPVGPAVEFALFHNGCSARDGQSGAAGAGFELGPGRSVSYSGRVVGGPGPDQVTVYEDDGTANVYAFAQGRYEPPAGVHDRLEKP